MLGMLVFVLVHAAALVGAVVGLRRAAVLVATAVHGVGMRRRRRTRVLLFPRRRWAARVGLWLAVRTRYTRSHAGLLLVLVGRWRAALLMGVGLGRAVPWHFGCCRVHAALLGRRGDGSPRVSGIASVARVSRVTRIVGSLEVRGRLRSPVRAVVVGRGVHSRRGVDARRVGRARTAARGTGGRWRLRRRRWTVL